MSLRDTLLGPKSKYDESLFTNPGRQWLFKPEICRAFETHYPGHIADATCSFRDRGRGATGP